MILSAVVGTAEGQTFVSVSDDLDKLDTWTQSGAVCWQQISGGALPEDVTYFCNTSSVNGTDRIYHAVSGLYPEMGTIRWRFSIVSNNVNSSVNNFKITLMANDSVPDNDGVSYSAFAVGTGFKTGIYSQLCLMQYHGKDYDILAATDIMFNSDNDVVDLVVERTSLGEWSVNGKIVYQEPEPQIYLADYTTIEYKHSSAKAHGAFNVSYKELAFNRTGNTIEAKMRNAEITSGGVVTLNVDGRFDPLSISDPNNYLLNNTKPLSVSYSGNEVTLCFKPEVLYSTLLTLTAKNIKQLDGTVMPDYKADIALPMYGDIVINEIMCDVSPAPANLPAVKYVELFNPTKYTFNLKNCCFLAGDYQYSFPETEIEAGGFLLICRSEGMEQYAKTVTKFDDSKLITKNRKLTLLNQSGAIVDSLTYTTDLYNDKDKSLGGCSIERRDPRNLYMVEGNWTASLDISGGTPGRVNSTLTTVLDNNPPRVASVAVTDNHNVHLVFSKNIIAGPADIILNGNASVECLSNLNTVDAAFADALLEGENSIEIKPLADYAGNLSADTVITFTYHRLKLLNVYAASQYQLCFVFNNDLTEDAASRFYADKNRHATINISENVAFVGFDHNFAPDQQVAASACGIKDIYNNVIDSVSAAFAYHNTQKYDILITEVLFYPLTGQKRFVELYNNTEFAIPLNQFSISYYDNPGTEKKSVIQGGYLLDPKQYAVVSPDSSDIQARYTCGGLFIQDTKLPAFSNSQGNIVLYAPSGVAVDSMAYNRTESNTLEINVQGVSLERVGFNRNSTDFSAWKFATSAFDYATPGLPNSNADTPTAELSNSVSIVNELFTPDGDGYNDEVEIVLNFDTHDTAIDVSIYNPDGVHVRTLANRENVGTHANLFWNGLTDSGDLCKTGIYVIYIKTISPNGKTDIYKKVCVLNRRK
ncbi:MAG: lamin tail domain-containing protein [Bacteroidales bacterium]|nr:lamin tail domain-containing protein [Bacteroidales bacterium]